MRLPSGSRKIADKGKIMFQQSLESKIPENSLRGLLEALSILTTIDVRMYYIPKNAYNYQHPLPVTRSLNALPAR